MKALLLVVSLLGACTDPDRVVVTHDVAYGTQILIQLLRPRGDAIDPSVAATINGTDAGMADVGGTEDCPVLTAPSDCGEGPFALWLAATLPSPATIEITNGGDHYTVTVADDAALPITKEF